MAKGRKKIPTKLKELRGTTRKDRMVENEMVVALVSELPDPPEWLSPIGQSEWTKVCSELYGKQMLHQIDLRLIESYCNAMSLHAQSVPYQKIANDALDRALKIAREFGLTPSSRTGISTPQINIQHNEHNYFD